MTLEKINEQLEALSGHNPEFYSKSIPGSKPTMGVRVPELRKLAKKIAAGDKQTGETYQDFLKQNPLETYEMEMLQAFVIGYAKDDIEVLLKHFQTFVPKIHDWAVNDALCQTFSISRKYRKETFDMLMEYRDSKKEFEVRVVAVTLMSHFLTDDYIDRVIEVLDGLCAESYYAKMGIAWAVATIMAKYPEKCMHYLKENSLDDWTYHKSIQKMTESYRVSEEMKVIVRGMKRPKAK